MPEKKGGEQAVLGLALKQPSVLMAPTALPLLTASRSVNVIGIVTITMAVPLGSRRVDLGDFIQALSVWQKGELTD